MNVQTLFAKARESGHETAFSRVDETHPVDLFLGCDTGRPAILVICPQRPPEAPALAAISLEAAQRHTGDWALVVRLERPDFAPLFTRLAEDLLEATVDCSDPGPVVVQRLERWRRMFSRKPSCLLEENELRGLVAELDFLMEQAMPTIGSLAAARAWRGPFDGPKDFVMDRVEVEVKAVRRQAARVHVSSLEQLTDAGLPLFLWTTVLDMEPRQDPVAMSPTSLVARARAEAACNVLATEALEQALLAAGYEDRPEYERWEVRLGPRRCYGVREDFPRLQRSQVVRSISSCAYEVEVEALAPYLVATWREECANGR